MRELLGRLISVTSLSLQVTPLKLHTFLSGIPLVHGHDKMLRAAAKLHIENSIEFVGNVVGLFVGTQKFGSTGIFDGLQTVVLAPGKKSTDFPFVARHSA